MSSPVKGLGTFTAASFQGHLVVIPMLSTTTLLPFVLIETGSSFQWSLQVLLVTLRKGLQRQQFTRF
jgi:hypothetical protein